MSNRSSERTPYRPFPTPALDAWRQELRAGERTPKNIDALWRAASAEAWALEFEGYPPIAESFRHDAIEILQDAAARQRREEPGW